MLAADKMILYDLLLVLTGLFGPLLNLYTDADFPLYEINQTLEHLMLGNANRPYVLIAIILTQENTDLLKLTLIAKQSPVPA